MWFIRYSICRTVLEMYNPLSYVLKGTRLAFA